MNKRIYFWLIIVIFTVVLYGALGLVLNEYNSVGHVCPVILAMPACYIVLALFSIGLIGHLIGKLSLFYIAIGILGSIALFGTVGELSGQVSCPKTDNGVPMCYISLAICTALLLLKYLENNAD